MALLGMQDVGIAFGGPAVLDHARFAIERGERVCLLGRNGAGKSTVMKLLDGTIAPDSGEIVRQTGITVARLEQEVPAAIAGSAFDVVAQGLGEVGLLLARYHQASHRVSASATPAALRELDRLHHALDAASAWQVNTRVETVLLHLGLDADAPFAGASGGTKRQILLARALVREPDVLLLDEPTNHLDIDAIEWLETFLIERGTTLLFVTHDRTFLRRVATRIIELDRGRLVDWGTDYDTYLERKASSLETEAREWEEFDKKLAKEEVWIRTGIQARRTRNEGRVRSLEALRVERGQRRERTGTVRLHAQEAERSGRLVAEAKHVSFARGSSPIITRLFDDDHARRSGGSDRSERVGEDDAAAAAARRARSRRWHGASRHQSRDRVLRSASRNARSGRNRIRQHRGRRGIRGDRRQWQARAGIPPGFSLSPDRARTPVRALSGGERNRLLLARLFTRSFNVLVLDEPTNDLDIETLDLLEELLLDFSGTLMVVSHDREFLDHVVTSTLVLEGKGSVGEYVGGYSDWVRQRAPLPAPMAEPKTPPTLRTLPALSTRSARSEKKRKLSFRETTELASLPDSINALERERERVYVSLADPVLLRDGAATAGAKTRLGEIESEIARALARWEELETIAAG